jgi:ribosome-associated translation inhibitor RaiA
MTETDAQGEPTTKAEVVYKGRNVEIPDHYRIYVELKHAPNRRQRKSCQRVEITARGRGPVSRAEACADSFYAAFESAVNKLENRLRRVKDRRKVHYGDKTPVSLAAATAAVPPPQPEPSTAAPPPEREGADTGHEPGRIVRTKEHPATPMTVADALYEMELVGHDFFLFQDKESERPSVVYRRHAYDYGLIRLS